MGLQGWLIRDGLARKLWEGIRWFMFCFLFTGQGRMIALSLSDEMNRANTLCFARTQGSGLVSTSWSLLGASATMELFCWCLKNYNHWSFYQILWIGESVWVFFLKVKLVKHLDCCLCKDNQLHIILKNSLLHIFLISQVAFFQNYEDLE